ADVTRFYAVDGDVVAGEFQRGRSDQTVHTALGGRVVRGTRHGHVGSGNGGGEEEASAALLAQVGQSRLDEPEPGLEVYRQGHVEIGIAQLFNRQHRIDRGIVYNDVEAAIGLYRMLHGPFDLFVLADICLQQAGDATVPDD